MRLRTLFAFSVGAAVGAGVTYLGDPEHGQQRRVEARRWAMAQGREQARAATAAALRSAQSYARAAIDGYRETAPTPED